MTYRTVPAGGVTRRNVLKTGALTVGTLGMATSVASARVSKEILGVYGQDPVGPDPRPPVPEGQATVRSTSKGISATFTMPTPEPGTYTYPSGGSAIAGPGHPEGWTMWAAVFPEEPANPPVPGTFFMAGHMVGGPNLTLSGHISEHSEPLMGGDPLFDIVDDPRDAVVHLVAAPHGGIDPDLMPDQISTPAGPPEVWWVALP